jgi:hypothetical protein
MKKGVDTRLDGSTLVVRIPTPIPTPRRRQVHGRP